MALPEINFYETDDGLIKSMAPILLKILDEKKKALIFANSQSYLQEIDNALWSYGRSKFIPHALIFDKDFEAQEQPILLTNQLQNTNNANYLIFFDEPEDLEFYKKFSRIFYFYEPNLLDKSSKIKTKPHNVYQKIAGKWQNIKINN